MRLSISNIAWDTVEDDNIATLLSRYSIDAIDIAPGKYFPDPANASVSDIARVKSWWKGHGIDIIGMQALLFGTTGMNMFGSPSNQNAMLEHFDSLCRIGAGLNARRLVFGSPKNRDRSGLSDRQTLDIAVPFFKRLGDIAQRHKVIFCLEPNPSLYGANFMTTANETADVVKMVQHDAIKMQLDTGANSINNEDIRKLLPLIGHLIGHIHISEPGLLPIGDADTPHNDIAAVLATSLPDLIVSIEMLATKNEPHIQSIERALKATIDNYRRNPGGLDKNQPCGLK